MSADVASTFKAPVTQAVAATPVPTAYATPKPTATPKPVDSVPAKPAAANTDWMVWLVVALVIIGLVGYYFMNSQQESKKGRK